MTTFNLHVGSHMDTKLNNQTMLYYNILSDRMVNWLIAHTMPYRFLPREGTMIIDDPKNAMLFKLVWM